LSTKPLLPIAIGLLLAGCSSDVALDDSSTCARWLDAPSFDQAAYVKKRRLDLGYDEATTVAGMVDERCAELVGIAGDQDTQVGALIDDAVLTHNAYSGD
jgi:hypothetical protein